MYRRSQVLILLLLLYSSANAQIALNSSKERAVVDFSLLDVISNETLSLSDYANKKAVVVVFMNTYCPYAKIYEDRIRTLFKEYGEQDIAFLLINSNKSSLDARDSEEEMRKHAKSKGYPFPYLADKENIAKDILKAEKTPETFVLTVEDGTFVVAYRGAIDDNPQSPEQVGSNYIRMALNNIVQQKPSPVSYKRPVGCRIKSI